MYKTRTAPRLLRQVGGKSHAKDEHHEDPLPRPSSSRLTDLTGDESRVDEDIHREPDSGSDSDGGLSSDGKDNNIFAHRRTARKIVGPRSNIHSSSKDKSGPAPSKSRTKGVPSVSLDTTLASDNAEKEVFSSQGSNKRSKVATYGRRTKLRKPNSSAEQKAAHDASRDKSEFSSICSRRWHWLTV